jgi:archaemetzincin
VSDVPAHRHSEREPIEPGHIDLVPIFLSGSSELFRRLGEAIERTYALPVEVHPPWFDPEHAYDPARGQYDSTRLLAALRTSPRPSAARVVGVAAVDLFVPVLTYVFGEAQLGGRAAVLSTHRLRPEVYGLAPDEDLVAERAEKEALHELGHTWGLLHCHEPDCVMRASTYAEEIDLKPAELCGRCSEVVRASPTESHRESRDGHQR